MKIYKLVYLLFIFSLPGIEGYSQSFRPDHLSGLQLWLRADSNVVLNGSAVSQWNDCSGNSYNSSQATAANQPAFTASLTEINNKPALQFDGTNDFLTGTTIPNINSSSLSIFIVAKNSASSSTLCMLTINTYLTGLTIAKFYTGQFAYYSNGSGKTSLNSEDCSNSGTPFRIYSATKDLNVIVKMYVNSAFRNSATTSAYIGSFTNDIYKVGYDNSSIKYWKGYIAEVILYSDLLADSNRVKVENYLHQKYSSPVNLGPDVTSPYGFCNSVLDAGSRFVSYLWSTGDTTQTITADHSGTYWVSVTDIFGFPSTDSIFITTPVVAAHDTTICINDTVLLQTGLGAGYTFLWSDSSTGADLLTATAGQYWVKITDTLGCNLTKNITVTVDSFAVKAGLGPDRSVCHGELLGLVYGAQQAIAYQWSDNSGNATLPVNDPPGTNAQYALTVTDIQGCIAVDSINVFVKGNIPTVDFTTDSVCLGSVTQFTDHSSPSPPENIINWQWQFGDGDSSTLTSPAHTYGSFGNYYATLTVTTDSGCFKSLSLPLVVWGYPQPGFLPLSGCSEIPVSFTDHSTNPMGANNKWSWDFGLPGNADTSALQNPQIIFDTAGIFTVTLIVTSASGCSDSIKQSISIRSSLQPDFTTSNVCEGQTANFHDLTNAPPWNSIQSWKWVFGDGDSSLLVNPSHTYIAAGTYNVKLSVHSLSGCSNTIEKPVQIYSTPIAGTGSTTLCVGQSGQFADSSIVAGDTINQWYWNFAGEGNIFLQQPYFAANDTGLLYITHAVTTVDGCTDTTNSTVTVHPLPHADFTMTPEFGPAPLTVDFLNTSTGDAAWFWSFGDGNTSSLENPQNVYLADSIYKVQLMVFSPFGCFDTVSYRVYALYLFADIEVLKTYAYVDGSDLVISADLVNSGMRPITQLLLSAHFNSSNVFTETWNGLLRSGDQLHYDFNARIKVAAGQNLDYACVRAAIAGYDPDDKPENNEDCVVLSEGFIVSDPYPNPVTGDLSLDVVVPFGDELSIMLYDDNGREVQELFSGEVAEGFGRYTFDMSDYRTGVYGIRVHFRDKDEVRKFVKVLRNR